MKLAHYYAPVHIALLASPKFKKLLQWSKIHNHQAADLYKKNPGHCWPGPRRLVVQTTSTDSDEAAKNHNIQIKRAGEVFL